jgi:uncharacterized protein YqeY
MKNKIHKLLNQARKTRDYSALSAYQSIYSSIQEREAKENVSLTDEQVLSVIEKEQKAFKESADLFADKKPLESKTYRLKAQFCADLLPEKIDESEYENIVSESFQEVGEDMGKVMKYLKEKYGKTIDMKKVSDIVRGRL